MRTVIGWIGVVAQVLALVVGISVAMVGGCMVAPMTAYAIAGAPSTMDVSFMTTFCLVVGLCALYEAWSLTVHNTWAYETEVPCYPVGAIERLDIRRVS